MARQPEPHHPPAQSSPGRQAFCLLPFGAGAAHLGAITLAGRLERQGPLLALEFLLAGEASGGEEAILWPAPGGEPRRRDGLWQHTCLEWFVGQPHQQAYWEFNLSPNGDWNVYALDGYRRGLRPDPRYGDLPMQAGIEERGRSFRVTAPLPAPLAAAPSLELAVTAVLEQRSGAISYWALHHGGAEADFHRRDGFLLRI
jgi:hypothetical protein